VRRRYASAEQVLADLEQEFVARPAPAPEPKPSGPKSRACWLASSPGRAGRDWLAVFGGTIVLVGVVYAGVRMYLHEQEKTARRSRRRPPT